MPIHANSARSRRAQRASLRIAAVVLSLGLFSSIALADALVNVRVRSESGGPVDGVVQLRSRASAEVTYQCVTTDGGCHIDNVPGGQYTATFTPTGGTSQPPRTVMIPPSGVVSLVVAAR